MALTPIKVENVNFYIKENAEGNHTKDYDVLNSTEIASPIFRRGCNFYFVVRFDRKYDENEDFVRVRLSFGPKPTAIKGTKVFLRLQLNKKKLPKDTNKWGICISSVNNRDVMIQIHIPPFAPVGIWNCMIQTQIKDKAETRLDFKREEEIYILFNPWCPEDPVFMEKEDERREYVLNEHGKIWCGTFKEPKGRPWIFGQFDEIVLPAAVFLLDKSRLPHSDRGCPILVSRAISAVINSLDDDGLLVGKWDGDYSDGTSPYDWTGTSLIMDKFLSTGGEPVKYGQCWVFSAATVTVCRALGIPCRSTTNYVSAHDTNCSLTVDKFFDVKGNKIENGPDGEPSDMCWNFHVWNDVWMTRSDLPSGYGGWQIIDATPQELSENVYRCGPASVEAVRRGQVGFLYDCRFVFSEVNADLVHFKEDHESDWGFSRLSINKYHVGRKILTQKVGVYDENGDTDYWDVTECYKNPEGTEAERLAFYNAVKGVPKALEFYEMSENIVEDVFFDLVEIDKVSLGESFSVLVNMENRSNQSRSIHAALSATSIYYNGSAAGRIKKSEGSLVLMKGQKETLKLTVDPVEYVSSLVEHGMVKLYAIASVKETKQTWSEEDDFVFQIPSIKINIMNVCKVGQNCEVNFSFTNPLKFPLTNCTFTFEGPGLHKPKTKKYKEVGPLEEFNISEVFIAKRTGERKIVAKFNSKQVAGIEGSASVKIIN